jgi:hypothetical protein
MTATLRASVVSIGWLVVPVAVASETPESPHGRPDACDDCHSGPPSASNVDLAVTACRECHPTADMHPVNVAPVAAVIPEGWPLHDGQVVCSTCHAEPSCGPGRMQEAPYWRGGPAARTREFCDRCHEPVRFERTNPHHPAVADNTDPSCAACHVRAAAGGRGGPAHGRPDAVRQLPPGPRPRRRRRARRRDARPCARGAHARRRAHRLHHLPRRTRRDAGAGAAVAPRDRVARGVRRAGVGDAPPDPASWPANEEATPLLARPVHDDALCASCHGALP